ncbi:hypothetical protein H9P43_006118 [Blastocladiella emersonii ATCC 22665]|nr:hypothetical protein H9P43_006118 [Blastocladiella emersonii ATCC 22665]
MNGPIKGVLALLALLAAALAVAAGVYWPFVSRTYDLAFPASWPEHSTTNLAKRCTTLDKSLYGCEDVVVHGDYAYLACSSQEARAAWFPAVGHRDAAAKVPADKFYVYDFAEKELKPVKVLGTPGIGAGLSLHGLAVHDGLKPNKVVVAAVNHRRAGGSCVELFDHRTGTDELIHFETVCDPLIYNPNDIAMVSRRSFYVTNFLSKDADAKQAQREAMFRSATSNIVFRGEDGKVTVVREGLAGANGIALSPNKQQLYLAESTSGELSIWDIQADHSLRLSGPKLVAPTPLDNINVIPETGAIVLGAPASTWAYYRASQAKFAYSNAKKPAGGSTKGGKAASAAPVGPPVPSAVLLVTNATSNAEKFYGQRYRIDPVIVDPEGSFLYALSAAAVHWPSKKALLGGPFMRSVAICDWPEQVPTAGASEKSKKASK